MNEIIIYGEVGDEQITVELSPVLGTGSIAWSINIGKFSVGEVFYRYKQWGFSFSKLSNLCTEDGYILIDILKGFYDNPDYKDFLY